MYGLAQGWLLISYIELLIFQNSLLEQSVCQLYFWNYNEYKPKKGQIHFLFDLNITPVQIFCTTV